MHYLGYVPTSQAYDNLNQMYDRSEIASASVAQRSFVWAMTSYEFTDIMNAYRTNYGTGARAFIASSYCYSFISDEQVFGSATTKVVDWFELNDATDDEAYYMYSGSATTENNMFKVQSGYTINMYYINIDAISISRSLYINGGTIMAHDCSFSRGKYSNIYVASGTFTCDYTSIYEGNTANNGGGMYIAGGTVNLNTTTSIYNNTTSGEGGAIYMSGGTVTLNGATIGRTSNTLATSSNKSNLANHGGGIRQTGGTLNIQGSTVIGGNYAKGPNGNDGDGGGINTTGSSSVVTFVPTWYGSIKYNACSRSGGGIICGGKLTLVGTGHIQNNEAGPANQGHGGGVYIYGGNASNTISRSVKIHDNTAWRAGGIAVTGSGTVLAISSSNVEIYSNKVRSLGGGVGAWQSARINFSAGKIRNNSNISGYTINGAGVWLQSNASLYMTGANAAIYSNTGANYGGGVFLEAWSNGVVLPYFEMSNGKIYGNTATTDGGGVWFGKTTYNNATYQSTFKFSGGTIGSDSSPNTAGSGGGGVFNSGGVFNMLGGTIGSTATSLATSSNRGNQAKYAGGYYNANGGSASITGGTIGHNYATSSEGAIASNSNLTIGGSAKVQYNFSANHGGAITQFDGGTLTINGASVLIQNNKANTWGGGIALVNGGKCVFTAGSVNNNTAVQMGGGFALWDDISSHTNANTTLTINGANALIKGNQATGYSAGSNGGGIWINKATVTMSNGWIGQDEAYDVDIDASTYSNFADNAGGGVFLCSVGVFNMSGGYIAGNWANGNKGAGGGGIYCEEGALNITGGYIDCNGTTQWGGGIRLGHKIYTISNASISYNIAPNAAGISYNWTNGPMWTYPHNSAKWGDYDFDASYAEDWYWECAEAIGEEPTEQEYIEAGLGNNRRTVAKLTLTSCSLKGNTAVSSNGAWGDGGALYMNGGTLLINGGTLIGDNTKTTAATSSAYSNKANYGAGIYLNNYAYMMEQTASSNFTIAYNYALSEGAGIYIRDYCYVNLRYGTIQYCASGGYGPSVRAFATGQVKIYADMVIKGNSGSYNVLTWWSGMNNYTTSSIAQAVQPAVCNPYVLVYPGWGTVVSNTFDTYRVNFGIKGSYNGRQNYDVVSGYSLAGYWEEEDQLLWDMYTVTSYPADLKNKIKVTYTLQYYYRNTWSNSGGYPKTKEFDNNGENNGTQYSCSAGFGDPSSLRIIIKLEIYQDYYGSQFTLFNQTYQYY